jgi:Mg2+-importing ATPase
MLSNLQQTPHARRTTKPKGNSIRVSAILSELARSETGEVFTRLKTSRNGLTQADAQERLVEQGPNLIAAEKQRGWLWRLFNATRNLLVILLTVLATISFATGDFRAGTVMLMMVILGVTLRFVQESRGCRGGKAQSDDQRNCDCRT